MHWNPLSRICDRKYVVTEGIVLAFQRGDELARFEMGSTVVLVTPPGVAGPSVLAGRGATIRMGATLGRYL